MRRVDRVRNWPASCSSLARVACVRGTLRHPGAVLAAAQLAGAGEMVERTAALAFGQPQESERPGGTFQGAGVKTVVLFFEKGAPTRKVWYYQLDPGRNMGKTNPLNDADLAEFIELQKTFADSPKSWSVDTLALSAAEGFDLSVKNPNGGEEVVHCSPQAIMDEIAALDAESAEVLGKIRALL